MKKVQSYYGAYFHGAWIVGLATLSAIVAGSAFVSGDFALFMVFGLAYVALFWKHIKNTRYYREVDVQSNIGKTDEIDDYQ